MSFFGKTTAATATNARSSSSSSTTATASATAPATATDMNDVKTDLTPNGVPVIINTNDVQISCNKILFQQLLIKFAMDFGRDDVPYKPAREVTVEILVNTFERYFKCNVLNSNITLWFTENYTQIEGQLLLAVHCRRIGQDKRFGHRRGIFGKLYTKSYGFPSCAQKTFYDRWGVVSQMPDSQTETIEGWKGDVGKFFDEVSQTSTIMPSTIL